MPAQIFLRLGVDPRALFDWVARIVGSPRGRFRAALNRAGEAMSLERYLKPEKELPTTETGQWNMAHEDAPELMAGVELHL